MKFLRNCWRRFFNWDYSFVIPGLIALVALVIYPTVYALVLSLKKWNMTESTTQKFVGLANYWTVLIDPRFQSAFGRTMLFVTLSILFTLIFGFMLALLLNRSFKGKGFFRTLLIVPMIVTPVVAGLTWRFMYNAELGMINYLLDLIGLGKHPFLGQTETALLAIIVTDIWQNVPFVMLILLAGLESLSPNHYEAAMIDGANGWQTFKYVTLPLMRSNILVVVLFRLMTSFSAFDTLFVMTGGGPGRSSETLMMYVYRLGFEHWHMGEAAAVGIIMLVFLTLLSKFIISLAWKEE